MGCGVCVVFVWEFVWHCACDSCAAIVLIVFHMTSCLTVYYGFWLYTNCCNRICKFYMAYAVSGVRVALACDVFGIATANRWLPWCSMFSHSASRLSRLYESLGREPG